MRTTLAILASCGLATFTTADAFGQCQRGAARSQQASRSFQTGGVTPTGFSQNSFNPILTMQQAALQQAYMQQQVALQRMRMQHVARQAQARQIQLERRRSAAQQRRDAELARREKVRAENFAKMKSRQSQETLVALRDE